MSGSGELSTSQLLSTSWFDSAGISSLTQHNVLDYFAQRSNPFYDRTCNNEVVKMQRVDPAQLLNMTGIEYMLLHVQEPILYVIRKVHRQAPDRVTPLADYYVLGGVVYQCPDIWSIINSRLVRHFTYQHLTYQQYCNIQLSTLHLVSEAFAEFLSHSRYDPNRGYYWEFPDDKTQSQKDSHTSSLLHPEEPTESQRRKVDCLLSNLLQKFPPKAFARKDGGKPNVVGGDKRSAADTKEQVISGIKRQAIDAKPPDPKRKRT